jgi:hypothetical protein
MPGSLTSDQPDHQINRPLRLRGESWFSDVARCPDFPILPDPRSSALIRGKLLFSDYGDVAQFRRFWQFPEFTF